MTDDVTCAGKLMMLYLCRYVGVLLPGVDRTRLLPRWAGDSLVARLFALWHGRWWCAVSQSAADHPRHTDLHWSSLSRYRTHIYIYSLFPIVSDYLPSPRCQWRILSLLSLPRMHLLWSCWTDLADILHSDGGLSMQTLRVLFWWRSPHAGVPPDEPKMRFFRSTVLDNASVWRPLFRKRFIGQLSQDRRPQSVLNGISKNGTLTVICSRASTGEPLCQSSTDQLVHLMLQYWVGQIKRGQRSFFRWERARLREFW